MDAIAGADPTFVIVSPGALAYALDGNYVSEAVLAEDIAHFLDSLADLPSSPYVLLASMPDTSSVPFHEFNYAERYYTLRVNNQLYAAVEQINSELGEVRFGVSPLGELYFDWFEGPNEMAFGAVTYDAYVDDEGWPHLEVEDADGETRGVGLGRFQGFFSLDDVHLTPTGHALMANQLIKDTNAIFGPGAPTPLFTDPIPEVDIAAVISRDNETEVALQQDADELDLPDLSTFRGPPPPPLSSAERCAITGGPLAAESDAGCPVHLQATVDGGDCAAATPTWPLTLLVTVTDGADQPIEGAPVGLSTMPGEEHGLITYLRGGLTDTAGTLTITVAESDVDGAAGDSLLLQAGAVQTICPKP